MFSKPIGDELIKLDKKFFLTQNLLGVQTKDVWDLKAQPKRQWLMSPVCAHMCFVKFA